MPVTVQTAGRLRSRCGEVRDSNTGSRRSRMDYRRVPRRRPEAPLRRTFAILGVGADGLIFRKHLRTARLHAFDQAKFLILLL